MSEHEGEELLLEEIDIAKLRQTLIENRSESLTKLKNAHDNLVKAVNQSININIKKQLEKQPKSSYVQIIDPHIFKDNMKPDLYGYTLQILLDGYYVKEKDEYSRKRHEKAGITKNPLEQLEEFYAKKNPNFTIEDVSDSGQSQRWVIRVTF